MPKGLLEMLRADARSLEDWDRLVPPTETPSTVFTIDKEYGIEASRLVLSSDAERRKRLEAILGRKATV